MRPPSQTSPMPAVSQSPYHTPGRCGMEANGLEKGGLCPGSCRGSTAVALPIQRALKPLESEFHASLWLVERCCLLPAANKCHSEKSLPTLHPSPPQTEEKAFVRGGATHLPQGGIHLVSSVKNGDNRKLNYITLLPRHEWLLSSHVMKTTSSV